MSEPRAASESDKLIGQVLANRYEIESRLGEGAMGAVYRARHVKVGRAFAVKVLHPHLFEPKVVMRFEREAELAGRLRHPNVIGVVDVGEVDGMRYMVMDFAEGRDLGQVMNDSMPFAPPRIVNLVRQMLDGLQHAHEHGLIHRDFKPENVIIETDAHGKEVPRIVDFGIAILREGGDAPDGPGRLTTNGLVLGTPHYMAPEQAVADPIDHRIDLFAIGIIIYEMLCGKLPFDGSGAEVARANLMMDPPPMSVRVPFIAVDPLLEAFSRRLMAKKRDLRPATAKAARELLDLIDRDRPAAAAQLGVPVNISSVQLATREATPLPTRPEPSPSEPPPMLAPLAQRTGERPNERSVFTTDVAAVADGGKRKRTFVIAGVLGAALLGGAVLIATRGGDKQTPSPTAPPVVADVEPTKIPVTPPDPTPPATPPTVAPTAGSDKTPTPTPTVTKTVHKTPAKTPVAAPAKTPAVNPAVTAVAVEPEHKAGTGALAPAKSGDSGPPEHKVAVATPNGPWTPQALQTLFAIVNSDLNAAEQVKGPDAIADLRNRYRKMSITESMSSQDNRDAAAKLLTTLRADIAQRSR